MLVFHSVTASFLRNISCSSSPTAGRAGSLGSPPSSATLVHSPDVLCLKLCQKSAAPCCQSPRSSTSKTLRQVRTSTTAALRRQLSSSSLWQWTVAMAYLTRPVEIYEMETMREIAPADWLREACESHLACLVDGTIIAIDLNMAISCNIMQYCCIQPGWNWNSRTTTSHRPRGSWRLAFRPSWGMLIWGHYRALSSRGMQKKTQQ